MELASEQLPAGCIYMYLYRYMYTYGIYIHTLMTMELAYIIRSRHSVAAASTWQIETIAQVGRHELRGEQESPIKIPRAGRR